MDAGATREHGMNFLAQGSASLLSVLRVRGSRRSYSRSRLTGRGMPLPRLQAKDVTEG